MCHALLDSAAIVGGIFLCPHKLTTVCRVDDAEFPRGAVVSTAIPGANTWYFHTGMVAPMYVGIRVGLLLYHRLASIYASLLKLSPVVPFPPQVVS